MKTLTRLILLGTVLGLAGCSGTASPDVTWTEVSEHTACEALNPQFCVGAYGFTVRSDGTYTVGPGGGDETLTGSVTSDERTRLSADAVAATASITEQTICDPAALVPGLADRVDLVAAPAGIVPVYQVNPGAICYRAARDASYALHDDLAVLMRKYYPRPFPPA